MWRWWPKAKTQDGEGEPPSPPEARQWLRRVLIGVGVATLVLASAVGVIALWVFMILPRSLPPVSALETFQPVLGSRIYDDNDELITELHAERRIFVPLAQIPLVLRDAIIATEDRRFYSHWGIDPIGIARAVVQNYRRGRIVEAAARSPSSSPRSFSSLPTRAWSASSRRPCSPSSWSAGTRRTES